MESRLRMEHAVPTRQVRVQIPSRVEGCPYLTEAASPFSVHIAKKRIRLLLREINMEKVPCSFVSFVCSIVSILEGYW